MTHIYYPKRFSSHYATFRSVNDLVYNMAGTQSGVRRFSSFQSCGGATELKPPLIRLLKVQHDVFNVGLTPEPPFSCNKGYDCKLRHLRACQASAINSIMGAAVVAVTSELSV